MWKILRKQLSGSGVEPTFTGTIAADQPQIIAMSVLSQIGTRTDSFTNGKTNA